MLFGTAYFPRRDEWPAVAVDGVPEPRTIADYLLMPFREKPMERIGRSDVEAPGK